MANPHLVAEAFYLTGNTEKYGTGFIRIEKELQDYPDNYYEFKEIAGGMQIIFYKRKANVEKSREKSREKILRIIAENPHVTINGLANEIGLSVAGIEKNLKLLKEEGMLSRVGPDKGGYWKIEDD